MKETADQEDTESQNWWNCDVQDSEVPHGWPHSFQKHENFRKYQTTPARRYAVAIFIRLWQGSPVSSCFAPAHQVAG